MLCLLCERVCWRARKRGVKARTVSLKLRYADFQTLLRSRTITPTSSELELYPVIRDLFRQARKRRTAIRLLGICLSNLRPYDAQLSLFDDTEPLHRAVDGIRQRFGFDALRIALAESRGKETLVEHAGAVGRDVVTQGAFHRCRVHAPVVTVTSSWSVQVVSESIKALEKVVAHLQIRRSPSERVVVGRLDGALLATELTATAVRAIRGSRRFPRMPSLSSNSRRLAARPRLPCRSALRSWWRACGAWSRRANGDRRRSDAIGDSRVHRRTRARRSTHPRTRRKRFRHPTNESTAPKSCVPQSARSGTARCAGCDVSGEAPEGSLWRARTSRARQNDGKKQRTNMKMKCGNHDAPRSILHAEPTPVRGTIRNHDVCIPFGHASQMRCASRCVPAPRHAVRERRHAVRMGAYALFGGHPAWVRRTPNRHRMAAPAPWYSPEAAFPPRACPDGPHTQPASKPPASANRA